MLPTSSPPRLSLPQGSTDCHVHVFDPARFPFDAERSYTPPSATASDLLQFQARMRMQRVVVVQPSCYGNDNAALLDALNQLGLAAARGIAVLDLRRTDAGLLRDLDTCGIRGIRLNLATQSEGNLNAVRDRLERAQRAISPLGWSLHLHCKSDLIAELLPELSQAACVLVFDHFAGMKAQGWSQQSESWGAVRSLLDLGKTYIKLSAPYRISNDRVLGDVALLARALVSAAPQRMLWGSDWPHTGGAGVRKTSVLEIEPFRREDAGGTLDLLGEWTPDPAVRERILVANPAVLFGFDPLPATAV